MADRESSFKPVELPRLGPLNPWQELATLAMLVMDLCWLYPWFLLLDPGVQYTVALGALVFLGVVLWASNTLERLFNSLNLRKSLRPWLLVLILLVSSVVGLKVLVYPHAALTPGAIVSSAVRSLSSTNPHIPLEFWAILASLVAVFRGSRLADAGVEPWAVMANLRLGILMLLALALAAALTSQPILGFWLYLIFFLLSSLLATSASRLTAVGQSRGGRAAPFGSRRFGEISLLAVLLVGLAAGVALLLSSRLGFDLLNAIVLAALFLLRAILTLIVILALPFLAIILQVLSRLLAGNKNLAIPDQANTVNQNMEDLLKQFSSVTPVNAAWLKPVMIWGILIVAVIGVILLVRYRSAHRRVNEGMEVESILSGPDLLNRLLASLRKYVSSPFSGPGLNPAERQQAAARIRQIYAALLALSRRLNRPRPEAYTPLEFLPIVNQVFPGLESDLEAITQAYLRVRYGELPESRQEVESIEAAWARIRQAGKARLSQLPRK